MGDIAARARAIDGWHRERRAFFPFAEDFGIATLDDAYAVQRAYVDLMARQSGDRPAGYKIGLTSPRMQEMCRIDQPVAGTVFSSRVHASGASLSLADFGRVGLEFEICLRIGEDVPLREGGYDAGEMAGFVSGIAPAVELVDDRFCDYATLDVLSLIADNAWNAGIVVGEFAPAPADLAAIEGVVSQDGLELDRGYGREALGGPLIPLAWLTGHLARTGETLKKDDVVMTGSLVRTRYPEPGSDWRFELAGLGSVSLSIRS